MTTESHATRFGASAPTVSQVTRVTDWVQARALFIVSVAVVILLSLVAIPNNFNQDGWLAVLAGRDVATHGIPYHDYFTHMAHGVHWVDQQWLAQLVMYELEHIGGLQLLTVVYVFLTSAAFAGGVATARRLGGEDLHVLVAVIPGAFFYLATAISIRTQGLAYPFFVTTLWLLATEVRSPVRRARVYWVFPALVLWANMHGSVTMGVGLAVLFGFSELVTGVMACGLRGLRDARAWAFIVVPPLSLLATPYGTTIIHYYRATLMNSQFSRLVTEWKPATSLLVFAVPLFVVLAATAATLGLAFLRARSGRVRQTPLFDALVLLMLSVGAILAIRNITWFGLGLIMLLPPVITKMRGGQPSPLRSARVNRVLALAMVAIVAISTVAIASRPASWFTGRYPSKAIPTLRSLIARDPNVRIFADVRYADWLVWEDPQLFSGRIAYDTSLELLTPAQLRMIADVPAAPRGPHGLLGGYGIWVLNPANHKTNRKLLRRPGVRVVKRNGSVLIVTHPVLGNDD